MIRFLNIAACAALIGSAVYAYSIKYQTLYRSDQIAKLTRQIQHEKDAMGMQKAEWAHLVRPDRLAPLADKYLDLEMTRPNQIVGFAALPERTARGDEIGRKLEALGLAEPTVTPGPPRAAAQTTPNGGAR
jgi:cell division protein FtsL